MSAVYETVKQCLEQVREKITLQPTVGLVLGSGLGDYADELTQQQIIEYDAIAGFPVSTVAGHQGRFVFGYKGDTPMVIMQGRVHYYEGYTMSQVVLPIRFMGMLGVKKLILTNAAGGINKAFCPGDFMLLTDHIAIGVPNPLIGEAIAEFGTRFPDMSQVYSSSMRAVVQAVAKEHGIPLKEGVYAQLSGPSYETPAEVRMCKMLGADAVGMSTACEAIAARHMGVEVCAISCITNLASGLTKKPLNHKEVQEIGARVAKLQSTLLTGVLAHI